MPATRWLRAYAARFPTVELNNSFYRLPSPDAFARWRAQVPRAFVFAVKASRFLTHMKRLRDPHEPLDRLLSHARPLGAALGPILYQLPPRWMPDRDRLERFLAALPSRLPGSRRPLRHVIEMRDPRGYAPWVLDCLRDRRVTLCVHDMAGSEAARVSVGPIVYVRLHGYGARYAGSYPQATLRAWARWIASQSAAGKDAYVYFNNDLHGHAVRDADRLTAMLSRSAGRPLARSTKGAHT